MRTPPRVSAVLLAAALLPLGGPAAGHPNSPEELYRHACDNAKRSPMPQTGESFPAPLGLSQPQPVQVPIVPAGEVVAWDQAHAFVDADPITVEGTIVDTYQIRDVVCRLNFDKQWQGKFYIAVFKSAYAGLPQPAAEYYKGKTLRVTGRVTLHQNQPNLEVKDLSQIQIVRE